VSRERIKGAIAFHCDTQGCDESLETDEKDFAEARDTAKREGWQFRNRDGEWKHYCCARHEELAYRGQAICK
jgi:hypothetical protein